MTLDTAFIVAFFGVFVRCTAMLLASPLYGNIVPLQVRLFGGLVLSLSLTPVLQGHFAPPELWTDLVGLAAREAFTGLTIGFAMQILLSVCQMAGMILDMQVGIGSAQLFNPTMGGTSTPIGQFKFWLGLVLVFLLNGHQMMFHAFVKSYSLPGVSIETMEIAVESLLRMFGTLMVLTLQIAAPVIAVTVVIDVAAGLVNKAVPQTQPFLLSLPAKIAVGLLALGLGLPMLVGLVQRGLDITFQNLGPMLGA